MPSIASQRSGGMSNPDIDKWYQLAMDNGAVGGKVIGAERIAVMTALNIAHDLLAYKRQNADYTNSIDRTIQRLRNKLDEALTNGKQLEIHQ